MAEATQPERGDLPRFVHAGSMAGGLVTSATGYAPGPMTPAVTADRPQSGSGLPDSELSELPLSELPLHRGLPSPYLTWIFSLAAPVVSGDTPASARGPDAVRTSILLGGLHTRPAYVIDDPRQAGIQLALHPLAARRLLGIPAAELRVLATEGADVLGATAERLHRRLFDASWTERFALLEADLNGRRGRPCRERVRPEVIGAWQWLAHRRGRGTMTDLARYVALSPRQLRSLFVAEVGVGPKTVARLFRFEQVTRAIGSAVRSGRRPDLSAVAYGSGYADLSHLDRDFGALAGVGPRAWLAEERRNLQAGGHRLGPDSDP